MSNYNTRNPSRFVLLSKGEVAGTSRRVQGPQALNESTNEGKLIATRELRRKMDEASRNVFKRDEVGGVA